MNGLPEFTLARPASLAEAAALLAAGARALAGGTDLLPNMRHGLERPQQLVDLRGIRGLDAIDERDGGLVIGAGVTLARLVGDARIARLLPALAEAARAVAGPGHRSAATLGGNLCQDTRCVYYNQSEWWRQANGWCLKRGGDVCHVAPQGHRCHAAFSGDVAPALLAVRAELEIAMPGGERRMPLAQLYRDDGAAHLTLVPGEFVAQVHVRAAAPGRRSGYRKARARGSIDFPLAGVAVVLSVRDGALAELGVALSGTNSMPFLLEGVEPFVGRPVDDAMLAALDKLVQKQVRPMRSTVTHSNYRRQVASVLAQRLVRELAGAV
ncbi:MAG TPA: 4-hydroxybenzoyl-CoA reductase subunit beta [Burkholderiales bacterium]|nr:4-hydroxybenzoyl-CoA reductase subunit beta [Burkholderiales bacterium]